MRAIVSKVMDGGYTMTYETEIKNFTDYYKHLECDCFDIVSIDYKQHRLSMFVDDEGMLKPNNYGRIIHGYETQPLFGNIVVLGDVDDEGNTMGCPESISINDVHKMISVPCYITKETEL